MAVLTRSTGALKKQAGLEWLKLAVIWLVVFPVFFILEVIYRNMAIYVLYFVIVFVGTKYSIESGKHLLALSRENKLLITLRQLPDSYHIFRRVAIVSGNKQAVIDYVVLGERGVWCLKPILFGGKIIGKENEKNWLHLSKPGNPKSKQKPFPNPLAAVNYAGKRLREYLQKEAGKSVAVEPLLVFSENVQLEIDPRVPAVKLPDLQAKLTPATGQPLTAEERENLAVLLDSKTKEASR